MILVELWDRVHELAIEDQKTLRSITYGHLEASEATRLLQLLMLTYLDKARLIH